MIRSGRRIDTIIPEDQNALQSELKKFWSTGSYTAERSDGGDDLHNQVCKPLTEEAKDSVVGFDAHADRLEANRTFKELVSRYEQKLIDDEGMFLDDEVGIFDALKLPRYAGSATSTLKPKESGGQIESDFVKNCNTFLKSRGFNVDSPFSEEEAAFPLAYVFLVHKNFGQLEHLLRAVWHRQNFYCLHVDLKSDPVFVNQVRVLTHCLNVVGTGTSRGEGKSLLPQTFLATQPVATYYASFTRLEADLRCLNDLKPYSYKYVVNFCGQDYPLKTNLELIRDLKALNGRAETYSVDLSRDTKLWRVKQVWEEKPHVQMSIRKEREWCVSDRECATRHRRQRELDGDWRKFLRVVHGIEEEGLRDQELWLLPEFHSKRGNQYLDTSYFHRNEAKEGGRKEKNWFGSPLGLHTGVFSGSAYYALPKPLIAYMQASLKVQQFLNWTRLTYSPDEIFWATLVRHYPDTPGSFSPHKDFDLTELSARSRLINWEHQQQTKREFAAIHDPVQSQAKYLPLKWFVNSVLTSVFGWREDYELAVVQKNGLSWVFAHYLDWNFSPFLSERPTVKANPRCRGKYVRRACVFGTFDLPYLVTEGGRYWVGNKFDGRWDRVVLRCLEGWLRQKVDRGKVVESSGRVNNIMR